MRCRRNPAPGLAVHGVALDFDAARGRHSSSSPRSSERRLDAKDRARNAGGARACSHPASGFDRASAARADPSMIVPTSISTSLTRSTWRRRHCRRFACGWMRRDGGEIDERFRARACDAVASAGRSRDSPSPTFTDHRQTTGRVLGRSARRRPIQRCCRRRSSAGLSRESTGPTLSPYCTIPSSKTLHRSHSTLVLWGAPIAWRRRYGGAMRR